jgi:hypothetical protein
MSKRTASLCKNSNGAMRLTVPLELIRRHDFPFRLGDQFKVTYSAKKRVIVAQCVTSPQEGVTNAPAP